MHFLSKSLLVFAFLATAAANNIKIANIIQEQFHRPIQSVLAEIATKQFLSSLSKQGGFAYNETEIIPRIPLLPPYEDPLLREPHYTSVNIERNESHVCGYYGFTSPSTVTGLSDVTDDLTLVGVGQLTVTWNFALPAVDTIGEHIIDILFDLGTIHKFEQEGELTASVEDVFAKVIAKVTAPLVGGYLGVTSAEIDMGFKNLNIDGGEAYFDATLVDWTQLSENLQTYFDTMWNDETIAIVNKMVTCASDYAVSKCTLADITGGTIGECLRLDFPPTCFETMNGFEIEKANATCPIAPELPELSTTATPVITTIRTTSYFTTGPSTTTLNPDIFSCANRTNGMFPHPYDCAQFIGCHDGATEYYSCPPPLLFNPVKHTCDSPTNVECSLKCTDKADGVYPHPHDCSLFMLCENKEMMDIYKCPEPLLFDPDLLVCNFPEAVRC